MDDRRQQLRRVEKVGTNLGRREIEITPLAHKDRFKHYLGDEGDVWDAGTVWDVGDGGDGSLEETSGWVRASTFYRIETKHAPTRGQFTWARPRVLLNELNIDDA